MADNLLSRRDLLRAAGLASGGLLLAGCDREDPYSPKKPEVPGSRGAARGEEKWVATTCAQCPAGCGIRVRVVEGRAVKIEGNPAHPVNRGGIGPKGQSGAQLLYHPDRIREPRMRDGARGAGKWKTISWDDAIAQIGKELGDLRARGEARGLVILDGDPRGPMRELWERFALAYGTPNHIDHRAASDGGKLLAMTYMHGVADLPAYDWASTRYVVGFGASLFESWCQTIHLMRVSSLLRRGMPGGRVKFVQIAPRFSVTAAKADEWVPIEPATYGALALGIAHVLLRENLYDREFVATHTFGFENWEEEPAAAPGEGGAVGAPALKKAHRGFRDLVMADYAPDKVAKITGVSAETIDRLAHEMAANRPAVAIADGGAAAATNGLGTAMAIHALNALLGNLERPGGMVAQKPAPLAPWKPVEPDDAARAGAAAPRVDGAGAARFPLARSAIQAVPEAILSGNPYPVGALFLYKSNPIYSKPDGARWAKALAKVPLVVSFSPLPDESTRWADFVLPDHTYLERWELVEPVPSFGRPVVNVRQPVVQPLYKTLATGDALVRLAKAVGGATGEAFPWETWKKALEERLAGVQKSGVGSVVDVDAKMAKYTKALEKAGGWWLDEYAFEQWATAFPTPSGKFEFYSQTIAQALAKVAPDRLRDEVCLPHWEPPRFAGEAEKYPFTLLLARGIEYAEGGARHLPWLRELPLAGRYAWRERVEVHPDDAARLEVAEGEAVTVESPAGARELRAHLSTSVRPGTVCVPLGHGPWPPEENAATPGSYSLLVNQSDALAGILALQGTRVRVRKGGA
ncbi:MAG: molybdopterin-dependent oxidoreductase [Planctomycetes bacterium]|nr:molybdopterin-dependent oxidoreductase [Planctomycetota bacterium]